MTPHRRGANLTPLKHISQYHVSGQAARMNRQSWWVYVLELYSVRGFYVGIARGFLNRLHQHLSGDGSLATKAFGVLRIHHLEIHTGLQPAQYRESVVSRYYKDLGALTFGGATAAKWKEERVQRDLRVLIGVEPLLPEDIGSLNFNVASEGDLPLPPPPWDVPALRSDLTAPVPPAGNLTQSALL